MNNDIYGQIIGKISETNLTLDWGTLKETIWNRHQNQAL